MEDIRQYADNELSLRFLNEEGLYLELRRAARRGSFVPIAELAREHFIFNSEQLHDLGDTFDAEVDEYEEDQDDDTES
jgi:hypothetical protein